MSSSFGQDIDSPSNHHGLTFTEASAGKNASTFLCLLDEIIETHFPHS
ncbi:hypothetical protein QUB17_01420 [Microcoleus sp. B5-C4]